jgi:ribonuclease HII
VVAGAVVLRPGQLELDDVTDSKQMTAAARERAAVLIQASALAWSVAAASPREIDRYNIRRATALAMRRALARLRCVPDYILVDGTPMPELQRPHEAMVQGDARCQSIAAASVLAKVVRDRLMERLSPRYPAFGWAQNKGYATAEHLAAIDAHGPSRHHRNSFAPVVQPRFL